MDTGAMRRARQKAFKHDLTEAYSDDEACPPEWVELLAESRDAIAALDADIAAETERFTTDPDIRQALSRRERVADQLRQRIGKLNEAIARLNLLAPHGNFMRAQLDVDERLRPLYRSARNPGGAMPSLPGTRGPGTPRKP